MVTRTQITTTMSRAVGVALSALLVPVAGVMARLVHGDYGRGEDA